MPLQQKNMASCVDALKNKLPAVEDLIQTPLGLTQIIALLCICAEHTFTKGSVSVEGFGPVFVIALDAYVGSPTEVEVLKEIGEMDPEAGRRGREDKLSNIIKVNLLRTRPEVD
ncbi:hypothetical protein C8R45DRAFT_1098913 [Mycena sanguinolenta]|nr:hypothetical protein C8R45DRAFT_1098913 [Mycena sanguinolenta]